ncbi:ABC transporter permease [Actinophytocola sp.]|uniref:ABC transporter permease n=1 Tax=Actinophytocola sp. TaxID=1872138 RepID=UPI002ED290C3
MRLALHAEWTKTRTVAGPRWLLLGTIAVTVAMSAAVTATCGAARCGGDATKLSLTGAVFGQALVAILGVHVITDEYGSGMIRTTLAAIPNRTTALVAKAVTLTGCVTAAGTVAVLGSLLVGRLTLPGHGYAAMFLVLRATVGSILYLALIALFSLGIATIVRDAATSIGVVLGLLYLVPILATVIGSPFWQRVLEQIAPMSAGLAIQATTDLHSLPISPWAGLGVTAAWATAALTTAGLLLRRRDA